MWVLFGLVTTVAFSIFFGLRRYLANWKGEWIDVKGVKGLYKVDNEANNWGKNKGRIASLRIGCPSHKYIDLTIKPERWWDRTAKALGLSSEFSVGCEYFDEAYYLVSDHKRLCHAFKASEVLRRLVNDIYSQSAISGYHVKSLHYRFGRVWLELKPKSKEGATNPISLTERLIPKLDEFGDLLFKESKTRGKDLRDPFSLNAALILGVSTGLAVNAVIQLLRVSAWIEALVIDEGRLVTIGIVSGSVFILGLVVVSLFVLGRRARTHLVLIEVLSIGLLGACASMYFFARDLNVDFDNSQPEYFSSVIVDKYRSGGKTRTHNLILADWRTPGERIDLMVGPSLYKSMSVGVSVRVAEKDGLLGARWVESVVVK